MLLLHVPIYTVYFFSFNRWPEVCCPPREKKKELLSLHRHSTQNPLYFAVLYLARQYRAPRYTHTHPLTDSWFTDSWLVPGQWSVQVNVLSCWCCTLHCLRGKSLAASLTLLSFIRSSFVQAIVECEIEWVVECVERPITQLVCQFVAGQRGSVKCMCVYVCVLGAAQDAATAAQTFNWLCAPSIQHWKPMRSHCSMLLENGCCSTDFSLIPKIIIIKRFVKAVISVKQIAIMSAAALIFFTLKFYWLWFGCLGLHPLKKPERIKNHPAAAMFLIKSNVPLFYVSLSPHHFYMQTLWMSLTHLVLF